MRLKKGSLFPPEEKSKLEDTKKLLQDQDTRHIWFSRSNRESFGFWRRMIPLVYNFTEVFMKKLLFSLLVVFQLSVPAVSAQPVLKPRNFVGVWIPDPSGGMIVRKGILKLEITSQAKELNILLHHTVGGKIILVKGSGREEKGRIQVTWLSGQENLPPVSSQWYGDEMGKLVIDGQPFRRATAEEMPQIP